MHIIRTEKQRESLAKFCWNMAQISLGALVIAPMAKPEAVEGWIVFVGVLTTFAVTTQVYGFGVHG